MTHTTEELRRRLEFWERLWVETGIPSFLQRRKRIEDLIQGASNA